VQVAEDLDLVVWLAEDAEDAEGLVVEEITEDVAEERVAEDIKWSKVLI
jgi:Flp pilus assembly protein TadD